MLTIGRIGAQSNQGPPCAPAEDGERPSWAQQFPYGRIPRNFQGADLIACRCARGRAHSHFGERLLALVEAIALAESILWGFLRQGFPRLRPADAEWRTLFLDEDECP